MGLISRLQHAYKALRGQIPYSTGTAGDVYFGSNFSFWNSFWSSTSNRIDFAQEAGDLRESSIVMAGVQWVGRNLNSARPQVITLDADQKEIEIADHPVTRLLKRPNQYYALGTLTRGIAYSWIIYATAYIRKVRNSLGEVVELWWEPFETTRPAWDRQGGMEPITHYEVNRDGIWYPVPKEDMIVLRDGFDMETRCGINATSALLRDYYTDKQAAGFTALLLKHGLVPPIVVGLGDKDTPYTGSLVDFKENLMRKMSGNNAGEPLVVDGPVSVAKLGFDYSSVGLRDLRQVPQQAFCSAMGISPTSLYFDTSRKESTFANVEQFLKHDYRSYIVPLHDYIADELTWSLLPDFDSDPSHRVSWDYSQVAIMQPDQAAMIESAVKAFEKNVLKRSEAREMIGYKWTDEDDVYANELGQSEDERILAEMERRTPPGVMEDEDGMEEEERMVS